MTDPNAQDPTPEQVSGTPPRPGPPKPGSPRPGAPKPAPTESEHAPKPHPAPGQTHPHAPAVPASDPSRFGRVDDDGTAWVLTADGERCIGSWQAGDAAEGLEHFGRRYDDLATEVALLETRLTSGSGDVKKTRAAAEAILESLPTAAVIGDLDALSTRLTGVIEESEKAAIVQKQEKERHRAESTARKEALAAEAEEIGADSTHWKTAGDRLREILDEWKSIRGVDRKTDDVLWRRYSKAREAFNRRRGAHFAELDRERASAKTKKEDLVARAEALQDSTDWGATAAAFRDLLAEWKASGRAPREADDQLWKRFKGAQDVFFAARNAASAERDAEFEENARAKEALLESSSTIDPAADLEAARTRLRELQEQWEAIGKVPRDRMHDLEGRLRAIEKRVREASDSEWRRTDPEALARAAQFRERVQQFEEQAEKAQAKGRTKDADAALAQAAQWREWAEAAESAVGER
ncbi:DUF349 domain-containing protein [Rhodococcus sp. F64268]|uniref:DUF349 domain-containing protein n=1 Tax=Rhodococcus sp. F64268 TaxID=2926402 RepID=UPI001FF1820B|nr:DUF349 domain-containing protein [Rhodococcus sp. F64268]MCK0092167.1 DUF349 domain-containing protein [Rhodococcus sp. F64268]